MSKAQAEPRWSNPEVLFEVIPRGSYCYLSIKNSGNKYSLVEHQGKFFSCQVAHAPAFCGVQLLPSQFWPTSRSQVQNNSLLMGGEASGGVAFSGHAHLSWRDGGEPGRPAGQAFELTS